jgi:hypothetical protein
MWHRLWSRADVRLQRLGGHAAAVRAHGDRGVLGAAGRRRRRRARPWRSSTGWAWSRTCAGSSLAWWRTRTAELVDLFLLRITIQAEWQRRLMLALQSQGPDMMLHIDAMGKTNTYNSPLFAFLYKVL